MPFVNSTASTPEELTILSTLSSDIFLIYFSLSIYKVTYLVEITDH
jgi:hypothetical protein